MFVIALTSVALLAGPGLALVKQIARHLQSRARELLHPWCCRPMRSMSRMHRNHAVPPSEGEGAVTGLTPDRQSGQ